VIDNAPRQHGTALVRAVVLTLIAAAAQFGGADARAASLKQEQDCLALALYWEARGEGRRGMVAVGWTILNRVSSRDFPGTPCGVVRQGGERPPCQFSFWCDGRSDRPREWHSWNRAQVIAAELLLKPPPDPTGGSLYFHTTSARPSWMRTQIRTVQIGSHVFYR